MSCCCYVLGCYVVFFLLFINYNFWFLIWMWARVRGKYIYLEIKKMHILFALKHVYYRTQNMHNRRTTHTTHTLHTATSDPCKQTTFKIRIKNFFSCHKQKKKKPHLIPCLKQADRPEPWWWKRRKKCGSMRFKRIYYTNKAERGLFFSPTTLKLNSFFKSITFPSCFDYSLAI